MAGYDRHESLPARLQRGKQQAGKYRVMEIFVSGRLDRAFGLFNLPTYWESAYLLCETTPPFVF